MRLRQLRDSSLPSVPICLRDEPCDVWSLPQISDSTKHRSTFRVGALAASSDFAACFSGLLFDRFNPRILRASSDNTMRTRFRCYDSCFLLINAIKRELDRASSLRAEVPSWLIPIMHFHYATRRLNIG